MPEVIVVGAGVAGLAATHRLMQRGFDVMLLDANDFLGGKLGACRDGGRPDWHEHAFHQYTNWYHNFWSLMDEIGIRNRFKPMPILSHLKPGEFGKVYELVNVGSPFTAGRNLFSGVYDPASTFVYQYSIIDLLSAPMLRGDMLEKSSVYSFMASRPYMTETALAAHSRNLAEAFACPTTLSSARSYRSWMAYGFRLPEPSIWLLDGNTAETLFAPWLAYLQAHQGQTAGGRRWGRLDLRMLTRLRELQVSPETGRIEGIGLGVMPRRRSFLRGDRVKPSHCYDVPVNGDLVLAIPPGALGQLVSPDIMRRAPELANVHRLQSKPMISLELYFHRKLPDVPTSVTALLDSQFDLSFLDNGRTWREWEGGTFLDVIASDADVLINFRDDQIVRMMIEELRRFIRFDDVDLDGSRTYLKTNVGEELFLNEVGSWDYRPSTMSSIPNLFIAGDYCKTPVDVVTIEGAVASGLLAAEMVRRRHGVGDPVPVVWPDAYPAPLVEAWAAAGLAPAFVAHAASIAYGAAKRGYQALFPNG